MALPPEELARLRELGRERRRLTPAAFARGQLGRLGIIDTGCLTDEEVMQALASFNAGQAEEASERGNL